MSEGIRVVAGASTLSAQATTDRELARGPAEGREALGRDHSGLVYRIAYAVLRLHHDAEDATQETFMRVLRYSSKLAVVDDPKTWLGRHPGRGADDRGKKQGR